MTNDETRGSLLLSPRFCMHHSAFVIPTGLAYFPASSPRICLSASAATHAAYESLWFSLAL
jgi:hypothetical protein